MRQAWKEDLTTKPDGQQERDLHPQGLLHTDAPASTNLFRLVHSTLIPQTLPQHLLYPKDFVL